MVAVVGQVVMRALVQPVDLRTEPRTPALRKNEAHDKAIIDEPDDPALQLSEFVELRDHPFSDRTGDRSDQRHILDGNVDGSACEFAAFTTGIAAAGERIAAGEAHDRPYDAPPVENCNVVWTYGRFWHGCPRSISSG